MRKLVAYSSRTGNTKMIAEAVAEALAPCDVHPVEEAPDPSAYDFIAVGYWVDRGMPDAACRKFMATVQGKKTALFGTLGADPAGGHAGDCARKGEELMRRGGNIVYGTVLSQGKVDPEAVKAMQRAVPEAHPMTPERVARIEAAKSHPDGNDCRRAGEAFAGFFRAAGEDAESRNNAH
jgi:flavodoxin